jgi:hypothetical protein
MLGRDRTNLRLQHQPRSRSQEAPRRRLSDDWHYGTFFSPELTKILPNDTIVLLYCSDGLDQRLC